MRTNDEWRRDLTDPERVGSATEDLRRYLTGALRRVLRPGPGFAPSDLEDAVQEALLRILEKLPDFRGDSRFSSWASSIAIRIALTAIRRRRHRDARLVDHLPPPPDSPGPRDDAERSELLDALRRAIDQDLTPTQRRVTLSLLDGVPTAVLADRLGKKPNAIYKIYHDARVRLRRVLEDAGHAPSPRA